MGKVIVKTLGIMWLSVLTIWLGGSSFRAVTVTATTDEFQSQPAHNRFNNPANLVLLLGCLTALIGDITLLASVINDLNNFEEEEETQPSYQIKEQDNNLASVAGETTQTTSITAVEQAPSNTEVKTDKPKVIPINRTAAKEVTVPLSQEEFYAAFNTPLNQDLWHNQ